MPNVFRDQPGLRAAVGVTFVVLVWALYFIRVLWGIGPMHDYEGRQAPAFHYLYGALTVTGVVAVWLIVGALLTRRKGSKEKSTE
jgi:hypothetical protein